MSCSLWRYTEKCESVDFCPGDCDICNFEPEEDTAPFPEGTEGGKV